MVTVLRLIQSQPQSGTASPKAFEHYAQILALIFLKDIEQLRESSFGYLHNPFTSTDIFEGYRIIVYSIITI
jgi:hypothetical protein